MNNPMEMIQKFMEFKNNYKGNPQQEVQQLLSYGRMTQAQLNQLQQMATQLQELMKTIR